MEPMEVAADESSGGAMEVKSLAELPHIPKKSHAAVHDSSSSSDEDERNSSKHVHSPVSPKAPVSPTVNEDAKKRKKAMQQLRALAEKFNLPASATDGWTVSISRQTVTPKKKAKAESPAQEAPAKPTVKTTLEFVDPSGKHFRSVFEAVNAIRQQTGAGKVDRESCYRKAREHAASVLSQVPVELGGVLVKSFGEINRRPKYHNRVNIFPVGYCCELTAHSQKLDADVQVEFRISDGGEAGPLFSAKVLHESVAEEMSSTQLPQLYKKVTAALAETEPGQEGTAARRLQKLNFFPLDVERVIEGLEGSIDCADYQFHEERGFGTVYTTEKEAETIKSQLLQAYNREKRSKQRDSLGSVSGEAKQPVCDSSLLANIDALVLLINDAGAQSAKKAKTAKAEKAAKPKKEKSEQTAKVPKSSDVSGDAAKKPQAKEPKKRKLDEETKQQRAEERAAQRAKLQEARRLQKEWEKKIQPIRRNIKAESRKRRQFARNEVQRIYDAEHDIVFQHKPQLLARQDVQTTDLAALFAGEEHVAAKRFGLTDEELDTVIDICSCLSTFSNLLKLRETPTLESLVTALTTVSTPVKAETAAAQSEEREMEMNDDTVDSQLRSSILMLDNIHIRLTKTLSQELHRILGLLEVGDEKKSGPVTRQYHYRLPVNQLTWQELGRQVLLLGLARLLELPEEDIAHTIRGKPHHRGRDRSTIRLLKYRTAYRFCGNDGGSDTSVQSNGHATQMDPLPMLTTDDAQDMDALELEFDNEEEMIAQLQAFIADVANPENYRRCARILVRLIQHSASKNFVWEVDKSQFAKYYDLIRQPLMLVHVAKKLMLGRYGADEEEVPRLFYADIRRVCANSIVYNTEQSNFWNQADKLVAITDRLMYSWVLASDRPAVELLSDEGCMVSGRQPTPGEKFLRCGRCAAQYAIEVVRPVPPPSVLHTATEEWFCEFCADVSCKWHYAQSPAQVPRLWRDSPFGFGPVTEGPELTRNLQPTTLDPLFRFGMWGPSANLPWTLNLALNKQADEMFQMDEDAAAMLAGLAVLSAPQRSSLHSSAPWTVQEHIAVLKALCVLLRLSSDAGKYLRSLEKKCQKLMDVASNVDAREADFLRALREVAGDDGVQLWKAVAHDFDLPSGAQADGVTAEVFAGRCIVCKRPTSDDEETDVLLCDACDAEAHLSCVGIKQVPSEAWYCDACNARRKERDADADEVKRRGYLEEALVAEAVQRELKQAGVDSAHDEAFMQKDPLDFGDFKFRFCPDVLCAYCNLSERDLCSPFVIGQTPSEAAAYSELLKSSAAESQPNESSDADQSQVQTPYFPLYCDAGTEALNGPIVHEFCAAMMEQARRQSLKHKTRRARQLVAEETIMLSGVNTQPLGQDRDGRLYWRFPMQQDSVFVCMPTHQFTANFFELAEQVERAAQPSAPRWYMFRGTSELEMLATLLRQDNPREWILQQRIIRLYLRSSLAALPESEVQAAVSAESKADGDAAMPAGEASDDRLQIRLVTDVPQSVPVLDEVLIDVDDAADEEDDEEDYDETQDISHTQYFTFSSRKYFAVAFYQRNERQTNGLEECKMTYEIRRDQQIIATVTADSPWSDGIYYFASLVFRRPGKYTLSFFVEGPQAKDIAPLCFVVNVRVRTVRVGQEAALAQLDASRRQAAALRDVSQLNAAVAELDVVRGALLALQSALPAAAYLTASELSFSKSERFMAVAESQSWSREVEQTWLYLVTTAKKPDALMEALLLLEAFLDEKCLDNTWKRAVQALPAPSYALRNATCQAVALRLFVLDSVVEYTRHAGSRISLRSRQVDTQPQRSARLAGDSYGETRQSRRLRELAMAEEPARKGRQTRNSRATEMGVSRQKVAYSDDDDDTSDYGSGRGRRRSARSAAAKRPNYREDDDDDEFDDDFSEDERPRTRRTRARPGSWSNDDNSSQDDNDENDENDDDDAEGEEEDEDDEEEEAEEENEADPDQDEDDDIEFGTTTWRCERCGLDNLAGNLRCSGCDHRRPTAAETQRSSSPSTIDFDAHIRRFAPESDSVARFLSILRRLSQLSSASAFWQAARGGGESLRSVAEGVIAGFYGNSAEAFAEAVRKVFANAQENNPPNSAVARDSRQASAVFERLFAAWVTSEDRPVAADLRDNSCPSCGRADGLDGPCARCALCEGCYHFQCADAQDPIAGSWYCRACSGH